MQDPLQKRAISGRGSHHKMFFTESITVVHDKELSRSHSKTSIEGEVKNMKKSLLSFVRARTML